MSALACAIGLGVAAACGAESGTRSAPSPATTEPAVTTAETAAPTTPAPATTAPAPPSTAPPSTAPPSTAPAGPVAIGELAGVRDATIRIVGTGTFADPVGGIQANVPGSGSGFIIDPSGLAVTNNHVVTGAALLDVYVGGEDTPRNARVVAASECTDLAVIDIAGDGYPFLDWYEGTVTAGASIYAAGYPLGDVEYTVLDGIVSKERAAGETSWASVDAVIEHSADTLPGSSGGPLVTADARVVAVNYAGNDLGQSFAIGIDVARPVVDLLTGGTDVESIGINGEALFDGFSSGIWVYSVESGSPADVAGVRPGDLLLSMESLQLATDGTMADYCDVLRSHMATDTMAVEVYRASTDELLEGQLNGRALEVTTSFATEFDEVVADDGGGFEYLEYMMVTDDSTLISTSVPVEWFDIDGRGWSSTLATGVDEIIGPALSASPDVDLFSSTWGTPGVFIGASPLITMSVEELLDSYDFTGDCLYDGRYMYDDGVYTGLYDLYYDCGSAGSVLFQVIAEPADRTWIASVQIVAVTDADLAAADEIFRTFTVQPLAG
ncbi:MAG: PDZ domain-containing protein [Ilumatobacter sp.]|nr:PDZ domain-containing protein [Ilumatobacter sp.]